ncbi:MAG: quinoprotein dehydrogenase-associated SoxYZ-like carrier [Hyphomicrobium sp.]|nr:quinoprotein dehydrogenase-associated SoxYZ-like carrier [Hyphomicrobium sp.]
MFRTAAAAVFMALLTTTAAAEMPRDPLDSPVWNDLAKKTFGDATVVFDERVKVVVPSIVENQAQVPVSADARALPNVQRLIVLTDLNPIQHVLTLTPVPAKAEAYISFRIKVEQATPVRAAALTSDGVWHVGGVFLEAAGGGCSSPAMARGDADWTTTVGNAQGKIWRNADGTARLRLRVRHPMDTGLAKDNTPAFFIEKLDVKGSGGDALATVEMYEPVSEDPTMTLSIKPEATDASVSVDGRDNNGNIYRSVVPAPWNQSALDLAPSVVH